MSNVAATAESCKSRRSNIPTQTCKYCSFVFRIGASNCPECRRALDCQPSYDEALNYGSWKIASEVELYQHQLGSQRKRLFIIPTAHPKWAAWMVLRVHVSKGASYIEQDVLDSIVAEVVIGTRRAGKVIYFGNALLTVDSLTQTYEQAHSNMHLQDRRIALMRCRALAMLYNLLNAEIDDVSDVGPQDMAVIQNTDWSVQ